ncbi:MAG TPA: hypothetical protein VE053_02115 [Allosphingosinicella sp.]|nr:hypothetical protein [Allosphingosinicella sp.]
MSDNRTDQLALVRNLRDQTETLKAENEALKGGGGGGTSGGMDRALVDAKISASEARTDTKFAKLEGKIDLLVERSTDARTEARSTRRTVVGTGLSIAALLVAVFTLYNNSFTLGSRVDEVARVEARQAFNELRERDPEPTSGSLQNNASIAEANKTGPS